MRTQTFDHNSIQKLRKDFLQLTRNVPRIANFKQAEALRKAFQKFDQHFYMLVFEKLVPHLESKDLNASRVRESSWALHLELRSVPLRVDRLHDSYWKWDREEVFNDFEENRDSWFKRLRRRARHAWKDLDASLDALDEIPEFGFAETSLVEIEGFSVQIRDFDRKDPSPILVEAFEEGLDRLRAGLKAYKQRAAKVFPLLLQKRLPLVLDANTNINTLASYERDHIKIYLGNKDLKDLNTFVHVMAHEMGHHIYRSQLSGKAQDFWSKAIRQDKTKLDLREVVAKWPEGMTRSKFDELLKKTDPTLFIQLESLYHRNQFNHLLFREEFEEYVQNNDPVITVDASLPTGYSSKNSEEAFCEVLGRLVAYGPKTVPDQAVRWMKTILPEVKVSKTLVKASQEFYHVTHDRYADSILKNGIQALVTYAATSSEEQIEDEVVFLFANEKDAHDFGRDNFGRNYTIFSVNVNPSRLLPDPEYKKGVAFAHPGDIPPRLIERVKSTSKESTESALIRLGSLHPDLRPHLRPILRLLRRT